MSTQYVKLHVTWSGGYVALAFLLAVAGSWTTVELLLRRTGGSGLYNILLLVGAGIAFGSTATWAMHFVSLLRPGAGELSLAVSDSPS